MDVVTRCLGLRGSHRLLDHLQAIMLDEPSVWQSVRDIFEMGSYYRKKFSTLSQLLSYLAIILGQQE